MSKVMGIFSRYCMSLAFVSVIALAWAGAVTNAYAATLSKAEYEQTVIAVYDEVRAAFAKTRGEQGESLEARVAEAQQVLRNAAATLASARAPERAAGPNRELVEAWRVYASELDRLRAAIARNDAESQRAFNESIATMPAILQAREAAEELKERGFQIGILGKND